MLSERYSTMHALLADTFVVRWRFWVAYIFTAACIWVNAPNLKYALLKHQYRDEVFSYLSCCCHCVGSFLLSESLAGSASGIELAVYRYHYCYDIFDHWYLFCRNRRLHGSLRVSIPSSARSSIWIPTRQQKTWVMVDCHCYARGRDSCSARAIGTTR